MEFAECGDFCGDVIGIPQLMLQRLKTRSVTAEQLMQAVLKEAFAS
jgi:hypothetical protein